MWVEEEDYGIKLVMHDVLSKVDSVFALCLMCHIIKKTQLNQ